MSKRAEEAALKAYPKETRNESGFVINIGHPQWIRDYYIEGYEQAEKDLALTPDDIKLITKIHYEIVFKDTTGVKVGEVPSEVLRRFNEQREKK